MDSIKKEFEKRKNEAHLYLSYIEQIIVPEKIADVYKILKANYYLIVYNFVESMITECLTKLKDILEQENIPFNKLNTSLKNKFIKHHCKDLNNSSNEENKIKKINYLSEIFTETRNIDYQFIGHVNGNVNADKIMEICRDIGLIFESERKQRAYVALQTLLLSRVILSHGNKGFADYGKDKTIQDLKHLDEIFLYIEDFVAAFEDFITNKKFYNN